MASSLDANPELPISTANLTSTEVEPKQELYSIFSVAEVIEIINSLSIAREIPMKYFYQQKCAEDWDNFYALENETTGQEPYPNPDVELLRENFGYFNYKTKSYKKVNIIDVGSGNSYPVKEFITKFHSLERLNKYIAVDISQDMLKLSKNNIQEWVPELEFINYKCDIEHDRVDIILFESKANFEFSEVVNIILHLGCTIGNHRDRCKILKNFRNGMNKDDLLVFSNEISDYSWDGSEMNALKNRIRNSYSWITDMLNIKAEDCELELGFDSTIDSHVANIKFKENYTIYFNLLDVIYKFKFVKGEKITIWRHYVHKLNELLVEIEQSGLQIAQLTTSKDLSYLMVICQIISI